MKKFRLLLLSLSLSISSQLYSAASPAGWVIRWGADVPMLSPQVAPLGVSTSVVSIAGTVLTNAVAVAGGFYHALALRSDSTVVGWGSAFSGQSTGIQMPFGIHTNGPVTIAGQILSNVTAISAGGNVSVALREDGTVVSWGGEPREDAAPLMNTPAGMSNITAVAAAWEYGAALKRDGSVVTWGQRLLPRKLSSIAAISAGKAPFLVLTKDGTLRQWGRGGFEDPVPDGLSNVVAISAGGGHCLALQRNGTVVGWGDNYHGEATGTANTNTPFYSEGLVRIGRHALTNVTAIAAGSGYSLALKEDGHIVAWGNPIPDWHQTDVPAGLSNVVAIAAGENFCLAITTNAAVVARFLPPSK